MRAVHPAVGLAWRCLPLIYAAARGEPGKVLDAVTALHLGWRGGVLVPVPVLPAGSAAKRGGRPGRDDVPDPVPRPRSGVLVGGVCRPCVTPVIPLIVG